MGSLQPDVASCAVPSSRGHTRRNSCATGVETANEQEHDQVIGEADQQGAYKGSAKDVDIRPGTPEARFNTYISNSSLSMSEGNGSSMEQESLHQDGFRELFEHSLQIQSLSDDLNSLSRRQPAAENETNEPKTKGIPGDMGSEVAPNTSPQKEGHSSPAHRSSLEHTRNPSMVSLSDSQSSAATVIQNGDSSSTLSSKAEQEPAAKPAGGADMQDGVDEDRPLEFLGMEVSALAAVEEMKTPWEVDTIQPIAEALANPGLHEESLQCNTCNVVATSEEQLALHLEGKKHKRLLAMALLEGSSPGDTAREGGAEENLHCDLCDVTAPSAHHREYHLRGQKHQRREKQHQLMDASEEVASCSINAVLSDEEGTDEAGPATASAGAPVSPSQGELLMAKGDSSKPLRSPFEAFDPSKPLPPPFVPGNLHRRMSSKMVRFSGNEENLPDADAELPRQGEGNGLGQQHSAISTGSYRLVSGGSFSSPAAHFCPVCGIIATSKANLDDHMKGRRHARRLQYLTHMPETERNDHLSDHLQRTLTAGSGLFRQGSLVLPSSMDLTQYIGRIAQLHPNTPTATALERAASQQLNKSLSGQQLSWDSTSGLHLHMEPESSNTAEAALSAGNPSEGNGAQEGNIVENQPQCILCGITTTSSAHMKAHVAGRKHRRRVDAAEGRSTAQQSQYHCQLCDISTTSEAHLNLHLIGRAHRRRQKAIAEGQFPFPLPQAAALAQQGSDAANGSRAGALSQSSPADGSSGSNSRSLSRELGRGGSGNSQELNLLPAPMNRRRDRNSSGAMPFAQPPFNDANWANSGNLRSPVPFGVHHSQSRPAMGGRGGPAVQGAHPQYPVNMVSYTPHFFPASPVPQFVPGPGPAMYTWWPQMQAHGFPRAPYHQGGAVPMAQPYHGNPSAFGLAVHQGQPGRYMRPPSHGTRSMEPNANAQWNASSPPAYNCEVCNIQTDKLADLKQHLRGRQHMRRLHKTPTTEE